MGFVFVQEQEHGGDASAERVLGRQEREKVLEEAPPFGDGIGQVSDDESSDVIERGHDKTS